jgi:dTDP-4-amino-4,6-dideoxygalactose transaminase
MFEQALPDHYTGLGNVAVLEKRLKELYAMRYSLAVSSASAGLMGVALALDLRNASFFTTPYTWGGSIAGWMMLGNRPLFADIDPVTLTLDPASVRRRLRRGVRAILSVDIYGYPADQQTLRKLADDHGLFYVADCAQSFAAKRLGKPSGALADALVLSFTEGKPLQAGEGGAVLTNNQVLYERLLWFTQHPTRQRRELGLDLDNEFAWNARIHPAAASRALNGFSAALRRTYLRQEKAMNLLEYLQERQLIQPQKLRDLGAVPAFHRLTVSPAGTLPFYCCKPPVRLVYQQPAFQAQFPQLLCGINPCPEAEKQQASRMEIVMPGSRARSGS